MPLSPLPSKDHAPSPNTYKLLSGDTQRSLTHLCGHSSKNPMSDHPRRLKYVFGWVKFWNFLILKFWNFQVFLSYCLPKEQVRLADSFLFLQFPGGAYYFGTTNKLSWNCRWPPPWVSLLCTHREKMTGSIISREILFLTWHIISKQPVSLAKAIQMDTDSMSLDQSVLAVLSGEDQQVSSSNPQLESTDKSI